MTKQTNILNKFAVTKIFSENGKRASLLEMSGKGAREVGLRIRIVTINLKSSE
jgi:hypothetical protein